MIDPNHELSVKRQAEVLGISRASVYYVPRGGSERDLALMRRIDEVHLTPLCRQSDAAGSAQATGL
jgi:putative transposase